MGNNTMNTEQMLQVLQSHQTVINGQNQVLQGIVHKVDEIKVEIKDDIKDLKKDMENTVAEQSEMHLRQMVKVGRQAKMGDAEAAKIRRVVYKVLAKKTSNYKKIYKDIVRDALLWTFGGMQFLDIWVGETEDMIAVAKTIEHYEYSFDNSELLEEYLIQQKEAIENRRFECRSTN